LIRDVGIIIVDDGGEFPLSIEKLVDYPYHIEYFIKPKSGVSAIRQYGLDLAQADYVMFCDADDMFVNALALYLIFREINKEPFEIFFSSFMEEV
jgi:glycosyltransferase involved in cell wall biosynthesis